MGADVLVNGKTQNLKEVGMFWNRAEGSRASVSVARHGILVI